jgi:hypothetical protein
MERERCSAHRRDGEQCGAPGVKGATVCRRHGGSSPKVRRNAAQLQALREFYVSLPSLQRWTDSLVIPYRREMAAAMTADHPRRCRARRKDRQPCGCWTIRGAPQVRPKARERLLTARIYHQMALELHGGMPPGFAA